MYAIRSYYATFIFETAKDSDSRIARLEPEARRIGAVKNPSCKVTLDQQKTGQSYNFV